MPQGVRVAPAGVIQIGDEAPLFVLQGSGTVSTVSTTDFQFVTSKATIPRPSSTSVVAIRPADSMELWGNSADGLNFVLYGMAPVGTSVPYWVFDRAPAVPDPGGFIGFRTRNAADEVIFAGNMKPARIVDAFALTIEPNHNESRLYPAGRTYAVIQSRLANSVRWRDGAINPNTGQRELGWYALNYYAGSFKGIADGIHISDHRHSEDATSTQTPDFTQEKTATGQVMIVDVTNY